MENGVFLETKRLILKVLHESDANKVLDYYLRNKDFLADWEPVRGEEFYMGRPHTYGPSKRSNGIVRGTPKKKNIGTVGAYLMLM